MTLLTLKASLVQFIAQTELALLELPSNLKKKKKLRMDYPTKKHINYTNGFEIELCIKDMERKQTVYCPIP